VVLSGQRGLAGPQRRQNWNAVYTPLKKKIKFSSYTVYKEILMGAVAKSYMRKGFLIYEEMRKYLVMRRPLVIYALPSGLPYI
jgi:hypothetical protein